MLNLLVAKPVVGDGLYSVWRSCLPGLEEVHSSGLDCLSCGVEVVVSREKLFTVCFFTVVKDCQTNLHSWESSWKPYYCRNCS